MVTESQKMRAHWVEFVTKEKDMFMSQYAGYWLRGVEQDDSGWLVWEDDERHAFGKEPERGAAIALWHTDENLPEGWYRLDAALAEEAWDVGVEKYGEFWYDEGDAETYDNVLQLALLGEIQYG